MTNIHGSIVDRPQETVTAVIVVIFHIIADIMILMLGSQTAIGGPLSFLNGKI